MPTKAPSGGTYCGAIWRALERMSTDIASPSCQLSFPSFGESAREIVMQDSSDISQDVLLR